MNKATFSNSASEIQQHLTYYHEQITRYENEYGRKLGSVQLLAVSKGQSIEKINAAILAGQIAFGENYLQEALVKIETLAARHPQLEWHFIGQIQRNKTRKIAEHFAWVHSIANPLIAERLSTQRPAHLPPLNICLEVNISGESSKSGIKPADIEALALHCQQLPHLCLRGLMAIPAAHLELPLQRQVFHEVWALYDSLIKKGVKIDTLSMGMTADFAAAIAEGATIIRVGTGIFGHRE